jgi:hypothetical protein
METVKVKIPKSLELALQRRNKRRLSRHTEPPEASPGSNTGTQPEDDEDRENLPWRPVARSQLRSGFEDAAVLAFEEIDGVDVIYEEQEDGQRVAKLAVRTSASHGASLFHRSPSLFCSLGAQ